MNSLGNFVRERPNGLLFHYTSAAGIIGILQNRKLWATEYRHLNDRQEYRIAVRLLHDELDESHLPKDLRRSFERLVAEVQKRCFVLSFSERGDQLSQWRAYCPGGNGYSLGFDQSNDLFASAQQHSFNLIRCEYDPHKQRRLCKYLIETFVEEAQKAADAPEESGLPERLKLFFGRYEWSYALAMVTSSLKHHGFNEEKEWRLVSQYPGDALYGVAFRSGRFGVTPYFELPLQMNNGVRRLEEVIIGPTANRAAAKAALTILLEKYDTEATSIKVSGTPLR
jgi:hypothetical protein